MLPVSCQCPIDRLLAAALYSLCGVCAPGAAVLERASSPRQTCAWLARPLTPCRATKTHRPNRARRWNSVTPAMRCLASVYRDARAKPIAGHPRGAGREAGLSGHTDTGSIRLPWLQTPWSQGSGDIRVYVYIAYMPIRKSNPGRVATSPEEASGAPHTSTRRRPCDARRGVWCATSVYSPQAMLSEEALGALHTPRLFPAGRAVRQKLALARNTLIIWQHLLPTQRPCCMCTTTHGVHKMSGAV